MSKKLYKALMTFIGLLILVGCEKMSSVDLQGSWAPVYASGSTDGEQYISTFDGPIDRDGYLLVTFVSKTNPDENFEASVLFPGIRFFQEEGKDVFIYYFNRVVSGDSSEFGIPLMYKIRSGKIYRELPVVINNSYKEGSGEFDEGTIISFQNDGQLRIGNITYSKL